MENKEIIEIVKNLNPYPDDIFLEPTKKEWKQVGKILMKSGINPDRIFAKFGRMVWNNCIQQFDELLK